MHSMSSVLNFSSSSSTSSSCSFFPPPLFPLLLYICYLVLARSRSPPLLPSALPLRLLPHSLSLSTFPLLPPLLPQLGKVQKAASAAHTFFVANPSHLEMRNNIEKYRRMEGVTEDAFQDREMETEKHWVIKKRVGERGRVVCV